MRSFLLHALPKVAISRLTGLLTGIPLPRFVRARAYGWFARRYGVDLDELDRPLGAFRSFAEFFGRPLRAGARPVATAELVWPCDGKIVTSGPIVEGRIEQIKGQDYPVVELLGDPELAERFDGGSQATIYLAPGDYHRVHAPFAGKLTDTRVMRGTLFPVNPPAVRCIRRLFVRNARRVFAFELPDGRRGAVVMVGALNVGAIHPSIATGDDVAKGAEVGRFGFGSTVVALVERGGAAWPAVAGETVVRTGVGVS